MALLHSVWSTALSPASCLLVPPSSAETLVNLFSGFQNVPNYSWPIKRKLDFLPSKMVNSVLRVPLKNTKRSTSTRPRQLSLSDSSAGQWPAASADGQEP